MTDQDPIEAAAEALWEAHRPPDPVEAIADAVAAVFAARPAAVRAGDARSLANADLATQYRALRARAEAKYGPAEELMARMAARGGLSARVWC
jgi:hypothetical protein